VLLHAFDLTFDLLAPIRFPARAMVQDARAALRQAPLNPD